MAFNTTVTFTLYPIFNMEHFEMNHGKPEILYEGFRFRKDRDSTTANLWRSMEKLYKILAAGQGRAVKIYAQM